MVELDHQGAVVDGLQAKPVEKGRDLGGVLGGIQVGVAGGVLDTLGQQVGDGAVDAGSRIRRQARTKSAARTGVPSLQAPFDLRWKV